MDISAIVSAAWTWLTTDPEKTVMAFVAGAAFNAGLAFLTNRAAERRQDRRDAASRMRDWNMKRINETKQMVLTWMEWSGDLVLHRDVRRFEFSDFPSANLALIGDEGYDYVTDLFPVGINVSLKEQSLAVVALRFHLLRLLDQQERRALRDEPVIELIDPVKAAHLSLISPVPLEPTPTLVITADVGRTPYYPTATPADFVWLRVQNRALSPRDTAQGVVGHVWIDDLDGNERFYLRARWRSGTPAVDIGPGLTEQLDSVWKFPSQVDAYALNDEIIAEEPTTWQSERHRLPPGTYRLRVRVEGNNTTATAAFWLVNPGSGGPLTVADGNLAPPESPPPALHAPLATPEQIDHCEEIFNARVAYVIAWHQGGRWQPLKEVRLRLQASYPDAWPEDILKDSPDWSAYIATERRLRDDKTTRIPARVRQVEEVATAVRTALANLRV